MQFYLGIGVGGDCGDREPIWLELGRMGLRSSEPARHRCAVSSNTEPCTPASGGFSNYPLLASSVRLAPLQETFRRHPAQGPFSRARAGLDDDRQLATAPVALAVRDVVCLGWDEPAAASVVSAASLVAGVRRGAAEHADGGHAVQLRIKVHTFGRCFTFPTRRRSKSGARPRPAFHPPRSDSDVNIELKTRQLA